MKDDERCLLIELARRHKVGQKDEFADAVAKRLTGMHEKRCQRILEKWEDKGWWDSGVSCRSGWMTAKGLAEAERQRAEVTA